MSSPIVSYSNQISLFQVNGSGSTGGNGGSGAGEAVLEKKEKDDSGNETGAGEQEPEDDSNGYDKTKSFFDNISCEAQTDRKGKPRVDWRQERKLNSETFGVSSTRRGGGMGYRGRGGHSNYNNAGGYFHRGNHHQGGYNRNNNNNGNPGGNGGLGGNNNGGGGGYRNNNSNYRRHNNMRMNGTNPASTGIPTPSITKQQPVAGPSSTTGGGAPQTVAQVVAGENRERE